MRRKYIFSKSRWLILAVIVFLIALEITRHIPAAPPSPEPTQPSASIAAVVSPLPIDAYPVVRVVDGDTLIIRIADKDETVRLVGVNAPESVDPRRPVQCMGKEAALWLKQLVEGQRVRLEPDETQATRDRFGRLVRFVFLLDGSDVGLALIREGMAQESLYSKVPHQYRDAYLAAQLEAQSKHLGLWNPSVCKI